MLTILYEDERMVAVDKPPALLSTPSPISRDRVSCMSLLRDQLGSWVYPVHRLDRATSGILVFGRDSASASQVASWFRERKAAKSYLALARGCRHVYRLDGGRLHPVAGAPA